MINFFLIWFVVVFAVVLSNKVLENASEESSTNCFIKIIIFYVFGAETLDNSLTLEIILFAVSEHI